MKEEVLIREMEINQRAFIILCELSTTEKMMTERPSCEFGRLKFHVVNYFSDARTNGDDTFSVRTMSFTIHEWYIDQANKIKKRQDKIVKNHFDRLQQLKVHSRE